MLVVAHSLRAAIEDGMREYHLGPGGSSYKYRFTDDDSAIDTVAVAATATGRVAVAAGALLIRSRTLKTLSRRVLLLDPARSALPPVALTPVRDRVSHRLRLHPGRESAIAS